MDIQSAAVCNPKRGTDTAEATDDRLFPYYAGYSARFTRQLLTSIRLLPSAVVLDPWNGSGTTTSVSSALGYKSIGCDLNPVMALIARADLTSPLEASAIQPLAHEICAQAVKRNDSIDLDDPLRTWLAPASALTIRRIERQLAQTLVDPVGSSHIATLSEFSRVAPMAAVMYLALFRATRRILSGFLGTNPTWVKAPPNPSARIRPGTDLIVRAVESEAEILAARLSKRQETASRDLGDASLYQASSTKLPLDAETVDFVLTSPPYCTRIDYAVATSFELAVLGVRAPAFASLRRSMLGTTTVAGTTLHKPDLSWGVTCARFLSAVESHPSRASSGYYLKNHLQYFSGLAGSISEISRVMRRDAVFAAIVQDSYYKEIHNDLPQVLVEIAASRALELTRRDDFCSSSSMVNINSRSRQYQSTRQTIESVLFFSKSH